MKIIDLSEPLNNKLKVFPGDSPVNIFQLQTFKKDGWNMKRLEINGHDGTHVNAQIHGQSKGRTLDDYKLEEFCGNAVIFEKITDVKKNLGVIFRLSNIDMSLAFKVAKRNPKFVGLSSKFEMDVDVEKFFFSKNILVFERLANTKQLPKKFMFYGMPLRISQGDGSPIRAFAIV